MKKWKCSNDQSGLVVIKYFNVFSHMVISVAVSNYINLYGRICWKSQWMLGTWEVKKWHLKRNNLEVNFVNNDHVNCRTAIYSCLIVLMLYGTEVSFEFGFIGNDIIRSQHVTKYKVLCVYVCFTKS